MNEELWRQRHTGSSVQTYQDVFTRRFPAVFWAERERPAIHALWNRAPSNGALTGDIHLDIATGTQRLADVSMGTGLMFVGIDSSLDMLLAGPGGHELIRGDVCALPFRASSVQLITAFRVLLNMSDQSRTAVMSECLRVLAPGGTFIFNVHAIDRSIIGLKRRLFRRTVGQIDRTMSLRELEALIPSDTSRFRITRSRIGVVPVSSKITNPRVSRLLVAADRALCSLGLDRFAGMQIVAIQRLASGIGAD